jgi:hypothetical protein
LHNALKLCLTPDIPWRPYPVPAELDQQIKLTGRAGDDRFPIVIHIEPVELLSDVDILVVSENVYLELPQHFKSSVSAAVRRAAAVKGRGRGDARADGEPADTATAYARR